MVLDARVLDARVYYIDNCIRNTKEQRRTNFEEEHFLEFLYIQKGF